jgi:alkylation response protein AidB-like acyl-CoA dehydrogenase
MNMPKDLGGAGLTTFQQTLVSEQIGRVTNALGWVRTTPAGWLPSVATPHQLETWVEPTIRGERHECYAITEEGAGSDTGAIAGSAEVSTNFSTTVDELIKGGAGAKEFATQLAAFINAGDE